MVYGITLHFKHVITTHNSPSHDMALQSKQFVL